MPRPRSRVRYNLTLSTPMPRLIARTIPTVDPWTAGEMFVSPHVEERRRGLAILLGSDAARRSPLTHQLLAARVDEPDLTLRAQIVSALAEYFELRDRDYRYPVDIRLAVNNHLRKFDRTHVLALLELYVAKRETQAEALAQLLERIPDAAAHLTRMAGDRVVAQALRRAAIEMIGRVGFTDALAPLAGLEARLEGRRAGQLTMTFAPSDNPDDQSLLPALKETLRHLRDDS